MVLFLYLLFKLYLLKLFSYPIYPINHNLSPFLSSLCLLYSTPQLKCLQHFCFFLIIPTKFTLLLMCNRHGRRPNFNYLRSDTAIPFVPLSCKSHIQKLPIPTYLYFRVYCLWGYLRTLVCGKPPCECFGVLLGLCRSFGCILFHPTKVHPNKYLS